MYLGRIVEIGRQRRAVRRSRCIPTPRRCCRRCRCPIPARQRKRIVLKGDVPSPYRRPPAAASTRAARMRWSAAGTRRRSCATWVAAPRRLLAARGVARLSARISGRRRRRCSLPIPLAPPRGWGQTRPSALPTWRSGKDSSPTLYFTYEVRWGVGLPDSAWRVRRRFSYGCEESCGSRPAFHPEREALLPIADCLGRPGAVLPAGRSLLGWQ